MEASKTSTTKRRLSIILGIIVLAGAFGITMLLAGMKEPPERKKEHVNTVIVPVKEIKNELATIQIPVVGRLETKQSVELFAEVSGVMEKAGKDFLEGVNYKKGETLLKVNKDETYMSLMSKRSNLMNLITQVLPDLKFDFPESFKNWEDYLKDFQIDDETQVLPNPVHDQEKYFIAGKNIYQTYYDIKSLEIRLAKYDLKAPFTGIVSNSTIKPGTLVRNGQKLGEFMNPNLFDMEAEVLLGDLNFVNKGDQVELHSEDYSGNWIGIVSRISENVDPKTQTVKIYITVEAKDLKNGMFLHGIVNTSSEINSCELPRKLVVEDTHVFSIENSKIKTKQVDVIQIKEHTVVVTGLNDGTMISEKTKGISEGMQIEVAQ